MVALDLALAERSEHSNSLFHGRSEVFRGKTEELHSNQDEASILSYMKKIYPGINGRDGGMGATTKNWEFLNMSISYSFAPLDVILSSSSFLPIPNNELSLLYC